MTLHFCDIRRASGKLSIQSTGVTELELLGIDHQSLREYECQSHGCLLCTQEKDAALPKHDIYLTACLAICSRNRGKCNELSNFSDLQLECFAQEVLDKTKVVVSIDIVTVVLSAGVFDDSARWPLLFRSWRDQRDGRTGVGTTEQMGLFTKTHARLPITLQTKASSFCLKSATISM
jgi:hypothetical protein